MIIIKKIFSILFVGVIIFLWNKYAVHKVIDKVVKLNSSNKWLASKQKIITNGFENFYWLFFIMFVTVTIFSN